MSPDEGRIFRPVSPSKLQQSQTLDLFHEICQVLRRLLKRGSCCHHRRFTRHRSLTLVCDVLCSLVRGRRNDNNLLERHVFRQSSSLFTIPATKSTNCVYTQATYAVNTFFFTNLPSVSQKMNISFCPFKDCFYLLRVFQITGRRKVNGHV